MNDPIAAFADEHPAKRLLLAHAYCQRECAGREIPWPGREVDAFDQQWQSPVEKGRRTFSGLIYGFVCFQLILTEWLTHPLEMTNNEHALLATHLPRARARTAECRAAAARDANTRVIDLLPLLEAFLDAWQASILARLASDGIALPKEFELVVSHSLSGPNRQDPRTSNQS